MDFSWTKKDYFLCAAAMLFVVVVLRPSAIQVQQFRFFHEGLRIQIVKESPPRFAFTQANLKQDSFHLDNKERLSLNSTEVLSANQLIQNTRYRVLTFQGMKFHAPESFQNLSPDSSAVVANQDTEYQAWLNSLPKEQKRRVLEADRKHQVLQQDWEVPSFHDYVQKELQREGSVANRQPTNEQTIPTSSFGTKVYVAAQSEKAMDHPSVPSEEKDVRNPLPHLEGFIELTGGLGITPDDRIKVTRYEDNFPQETAKIDAANWTYQIQLGRQRGYLKAELTNKKGDILGEGFLRVPNTNTLQDRKQNTIAISPRKKAFSGFSYSGYYDDKKKAVSGSVETSVPASEVQSSPGEFEIQDVGSKSWALVRYQAKDHYPSLTTVTAGIDVAMPVFPMKTIQAMVQTAKDFDKTSESKVITNDAYVWGTVTLEGKKQSGMQVVVQDHPEAKVIYFQGPFPNPSLKATSSNGNFIIMNLPQGWYTVFAKMKDQIIADQSIQVEDRHLTVASLQGSLARSWLSVKSFDAFLGTPESVQMFLQGQKEPELIDAEKELLISPTTGLRTALIHPVDDRYATMKIQYSGQDMYGHIPLVTKAWLQNTAEATQMLKHEENELILGFVPDFDFEVRQLSVHDKIVYFDASGSPVPRGIAGGGFLYLAHLDSTKTMVVTNRHTHEVYSRIIPFDAQTLTAVKFDQ